MKKLISVLQRIRLRQLLTVFIVGVVLLVSTACRQGDSAIGTPDKAYDEPLAKKNLPGRVESEVSKSARYKPEPMSGMNNFSDVDPRTGTQGAEQKAQTLVKDSEQNISEKRAVNPDQFARNYREGTPLGERAKNIQRDVGSSAKDIAEDTKANTRELVKGAQRSASDTADRAQSRAGDATRNVRQASDNTAERAKGTVSATANRTQARANEAAASTKEAAEDTRQASGNILDRVTKSVKRAAEDTSDFIEDKTEQASKGTQRALEDAS